VKALSCFQTSGPYHPTKRYLTSEDNNTQKHGCVTLRPRNLGSHPALFDTRRTVWCRVQIIFLISAITAFLLNSSILLPALIPNVFYLYFPSTVRCHIACSHKTPSYSFSCFVSGVGLLTAVYYEHNIHRCMEHYPSVYQDCLPTTEHFVGLICANK